MASAKPYLTTDTLVESVKRRISFPFSQQTFMYSDIVAFANEEMTISAVPTMISEHEEFFIFRQTIPLVSNVSKYIMPSRTMGMALRDIKYVDTNGNFFDMTRIAPEDKAFFQQNTGVNQVTSKYYLEGNYIVLSPQVISGPTGSLLVTFFLRPNQLVRDDRACIIEGYKKYLTILDNTLVVAGDTFTLTTDVQTPSPVVIELTAVVGAPSANEFQIGATATITASNFVTALNTALATNGITTVNSTSLLSLITIDYDQISDTFILESANDTLAYTLDNDNIYIQFDQLPTSYTDPDTDVTSSLYSAGGFVDFLQTNPGHQTYNYDVRLLAILSGNIGKFNGAQLQGYLSNSSAPPLQYYPIEIGDYICVQHECIIPQIPPELHSALAERAAGRILMAIGDKEGYAVSQNKLEQMDSKQATLIGTRVEGSVNKVFNRNSLLRMGKLSRTRRV